MWRNSLVLFSLYCGLVHWNGVPGEGASCKRRSRGNSEPVHSFNQCFQRCFLFALFCLISISNILSTRRQQLWCSGRTELHLALVWFFVSASPVLIVLLLPVRYSSSASFKFLEAFSFLRQHPLGKRAGRVLSQGLGETSRNFLFLCRNRKWKLVFAWGTPPLKPRTKKRQSLVLSGAGAWAVLETRAFQAHVLFWVSECIISVLVN